MLGGGNVGLIYRCKLGHVILIVNMVFVNFEANLTYMVSDLNIDFKR